MSSKTKAVAAVAAALAAALLAGCATAPGGAQYVPLIDIKPEQGANYSADLADCQAYAERVVGAGAGAAGGAVAGALARRVEVSAVDLDADEASAMTNRSHARACATQAHG